jgi:hypothetical protein
MRVLRAVFLLVTLGPMTACAVKALDVGSEDDNPSLVDGSLEASSEERTMSLEEFLRAQCETDATFLEPKSGLDLNEHILGRWFNCSQASDSPAQNGDGVGIEFDPDAAFAILDWNEAHTEFDRSMAPNQWGDYSYQQLLPHDGGNDTIDVDANDPTPRKNLAVVLDHEGPDPPNGPFPNPLDFSFQDEPRMMNAVYHGGAGGAYVFIPNP